MHVDPDTGQMYDDAGNPVGDPVLPGSFVPTYDPYQREIEADPEYAPALTTKNTALDNAKLQYLNTIKQAFVKAGIDPRKALSGLIDTTPDAETQKNLRDYAASLDDTAIQTLL